MNPADFLTVANQFHSSSSEAVRRTSIGRSYYALYNVLHRFLSRWASSLSGRGKDHRLLVKYLTACGNHNAYKLGTKLRDLRQIRNLADYDMGTHVSAQQSQLAHQWADNMIVLFSGLTQTEQNDIINKVQSYHSHSTPSFLNKFASCLRSLLSK